MLLDMLLGRPKVKMVKRICICDKKFEIYPAHAKIKGVGQYCSVKCRAIGRRHPW